MGNLRCCMRERNYASHQGLPCYLYCKSKITTHAFAYCVSRVVSLLLYLIKICMLQAKATPYSLHRSFSYSNSSRCYSNHLDVLRDVLRWSRTWSPPGSPAWSVRLHVYCTFNESGIYLEFRQKFVAIPVQYGVIYCKNIYTLYIWVQGPCTATWKAWLMKHVITRLPWGKIL